MYTGSIILLFFGIQVLTGIMLAFYYKPTLDAANKSVGEIMTKVPLGWIIRSVHSWSATFMIAAVFIHMLSLWLVKSYRSPRELTWMSGVLLLVFTLAFGFTGYLLPWDELSLAATKVGTDIPSAIPVVGAWATKFLRGGDDISGDTLSRFFTFHVCVLPLLLLAVVGFHLYLIQKLGMSLPVGADELRLPGGDRLGRTRRRYRHAGGFPAAGAREGRRPHGPRARGDRARVVFSFLVPDAEDISREDAFRERRHGRGGPDLCGRRASFLPAPHRQPPGRKEGQGHHLGGVRIHRLRRRHEHLEPEQDQTPAGQRRARCPRHSREHGRLCFPGMDVARHLCSILSFPPENQRDRPAAFLQIFQSR
jgi:hypothetical protein